MAYEHKRRSNVVLNLTPLIDIVFLLLVFFMLTAHFIEDQSINIELPVAKNSAAAEEEGYVEVVITPEGQLLVEGQLIGGEAQLPLALSDALAAPNKRFVRLRGDTEARLGLGVKVMDAARQAGAESLDILTERP